MNVAERLRWNAWYASAQVSCAHTIEFADRASDFDPRQLSDVGASRTLQELYAQLQSMRRKLASRPDCDKELPVALATLVTIDLAEESIRNALDRWRARVGVT